MSNKKQYYSIKFPFTSNNVENYYFDLNQNQNQYAVSQMIHVIFTPRGSKLRDPMFGTNIMKYIFEPSFDSTWNDIQEEISTAVGRYVPNMRINEVSIIQDENNYNKIYVRIDYTIIDGNKTVSDSIVTEI